MTLCGGNGRATVLVIKKKTSFLILSNYLFNDGSAKQAGPFFVVAALSFNKSVLYLYVNHKLRQSLVVHSRFDCIQYLVLCRQVEGFKHQRKRSI